MKLYPHQEQAVNWLGDHPGLADDQGLGKTASAIVAAGTGRHVVTCPAAVLFNWRKEILMWARDPGRIQVITKGSDPVDPRATWVIVSHALLVKFEAKLAACSWDTVIVDEAQFFKTPKAQRTKALYGMARGHTGVVKSAKRVMLLTGTPMPNNPTEMWTHFAAVKPELIAKDFDPITMLEPQPMTWFEFRRRYCQLIPSAYGDGWKVVGVKPETKDELRSIVRSFWMRRMKKDVLDLPPIRFGHVTLTVDKLPPKMAEIEREAGVLDGDSPETIMDKLRESSHFSTWRRLCGIAKAGVAAEQMVDEMTDSDDKRIVFAHHKEVLDTMAAALEAAGIGFVRIDGSQNAAQRQHAVDLFQDALPEGVNVRVALVNIVAGGIGITLTRATEAVFVEQSWTPGENAQATDRLYRIGQTKSVLVRFLSLANSIDEHIADALATKTAMIRETLE